MLFLFSKSFFYATLCFLLILTGMVKTFPSSVQSSGHYFKEMPILKSFIKQIEQEISAKKKSLMLSKEQLFTFLESENNDDKKFLVRKAVAIMGYFGGLWCAELLALELKNVAILVNNDCITIFVRSSKTNPQGKSQFSLTIPNNKDSSDGCAYSIKSYANSISNKSGRFFHNHNA